ncbi:MAG: hypothetical protein R2865_15865 [Deinococcales bacterium]
MQAEARERADDGGYIEPHVWTGISRGRSGCGMSANGWSQTDPYQAKALSGDGDAGFYLIGLSSF